jgi:ATP-dependent DNA helicase RecG
MNEGKNAKELALILDKPYKTIEKWLKKLKENAQIEFRGSRKTGGYFIKSN